MTDAATLADISDLSSALLDDEIERLLIILVRERGGVINTNEVHSAMCARQLHSSSRSYNYARISRALRSLRDANRLHHDFGHTYWNLAAADMEGFATSGQYQFLRARTTSGETDKKAIALQVGDAFMRARNGRDVEHIAAAPKVRRALVIMAGLAPEARAKALQDLRRYAQECAKADSNISPDYVESLIVSEAARMYESIFDQFERGDITLYNVAPVEFYEACAEMFGVDAADLSRGLVTPRRRFTA